MWGRHPSVRLRRWLSRVSAHLRCDSSGGGSVMVKWPHGTANQLPIAFTFPAQSRHQHSHDGHLLLPKGCDNERTWIDRKCGRSSPYEPTVRYHTATVVVCARGVA